MIFFFTEAAKEQTEANFGGAALWKFRTVHWGNFEGYSSLTFGKQQSSFSTVPNYREEDSPNLQTEVNSVGSEELKLQQQTEVEFGGDQQRLGKFLGGFWGSKIRWTPVFFLTSFQCQYSPHAWRLLSKRIVQVQVSIDGREQTLANPSCWNSMILDLDVMIKV